MDIEEGEQFVSEAGLEIGSVLLQGNDFGEYHFVGGHELSV